MLRFQMCMVHNSTFVYCPTPEIQLPSKGAAANLGDLQFYMGLVLDGVPTYRNISESLPQFGKLYIFSDPILYPFKEEIRSHSPHEDTNIVIEVMYSIYKRIHKRIASERKCCSHTHTRTHARTHARTHTHTHTHQHITAHTHVTHIHR